jgi:glycosyltransferase involved in cell wall biosynthesis
MAAWAAGVPFIMSTEHNINNTNNIVKLILKRITNKMADKIAAVSGEVAEYSTSVEKADPGKIEVVYNGIDTSKYMNKRGYNNTGKIRIGAMGRLAHQKGFEYLIGALAHLDADFECEIAGDPDPNEDMTEKLKSLIEKSGMKGKVRLVGHREPTDFFRSIDIFVMSSRWEGFPLVLLEAGASGLPVVVPDLGGIREIITDRENGYLFAKGNEKELAERLTEMIKSAKEREVLAKSLYNEVINKFDINDMVARYDEIYERAVKI